MQPAETQPDSSVTISHKFGAAVAEVFQFEKMVMYAIVGIIGLSVILSFALVVFGKAQDKQAEFVLAFFKDVCLILVGALANAVKHKS